MEGIVVNTWSVIVVAVTDSILIEVLYNGSDVLGYVFSAAGPEAPPNPQLNVSELGANWTLVPAVKLWAPISRTINPVLGSYVVPVAGVYVTWGDAPMFTSNVWSVTLEIGIHLPATGSVARGYEWLVEPLSIVHVNVTPPTLILTLWPFLRPWFNFVSVITPVVAV